MPDPEEASDGEVESDEEGAEVEARSSKKSRPLGNQYSFFSDKPLPVAPPDLDVFEGYLQQYQLDKEAGILTNTPTTAESVGSDQVAPPAFRGRPMRGTPVAQPRGDFKLIVKLGNDHTFTKEILETTFAPHGQATDVFVPEGKYFAFVSFATLEVAETAGTAVNGSFVQRRRIFCDWAIPKGGAPGAGAPTVSGDSKSGVGVSSAWGDAAPVGNGGSSQVAPPAQGRPMRGTPVAQPRGGFKLMVKLGNDHTFTKESLEAAFSPHGPVADCYVPEGKHFAFVSFDTQDVAETAGTALNGSIINGKRVFCDWATPKGGAPAPAVSTGSSVAAASAWGDSTPAAVTPSVWGSTPSTESAAAPVPSSWGTPAPASDAAPAAVLSGWGSGTTEPSETPAPAASGWGATPAADASTPVAAVGGWGAAPGETTASPTVGWGASGSTSSWGDSTPADSSNSSQAAPPARGGFAGGRGRGRPMRGTAVAQPRGGYKLMVKLGNDHTFTKESLEAAFSAHGAVTDTYVPDGKHYAFVSFDSMEVAETAGTALNGSTVNGVRIFCDWAQPKGGAGGGGAPGGKGCFKCGQEGHMSRDCTGAPASTSDSSSSAWGAPASSSGWGDSSTAPAASVAASGWGSSEATPAAVSSGWGSSETPAPAASGGGWGAAAPSETTTATPTPVATTWGNSTAADSAVPAVSSGWGGASTEESAAPVAAVVGGWGGAPSTNSATSDAPSPVFQATPLGVLATAPDRPVDTRPLNERLMAMAMAPGLDPSPAPSSSSWGSSETTPAAGGWGTSGAAAPAAGTGWGTESTAGGGASAWGGSTAVSQDSTTSTRGGFAGRGRGRPMRGTPVAQPRGGYKLMIKLGDDHKFTKDSLEAAFSPHGTVTDCYVPDGKHFAFVSFGSQEEAETAGTALNGSTVNGTRFNCDWAQPKGGGGGGAPGGKGCFKCGQEGHMSRDCTGAAASTTDSSSSAWGAPASGGSGWGDSTATAAPAVTSSGWGSTPSSEVSAPVASGWGSSEPAAAASTGWGSSTMSSDTTAPVATGWGATPASDNSTAPVPAVGGWGAPAASETTPTTAPAAGGWGSTSSWGDPVPSGNTSSSPAPAPSRGGFAGGRGRGRPMRGTAVAQPRGGYKLMVKLGNDHTFTKETLESAFGAHGPVSDCYVPEGKHFAFVSFETQEVAETAGTALNGSDLNGKRIFCDWAQPKGGAPAPAATTDSSASWGAPATSSGWGDSAAATAPAATSSGWGSAPTTASAPVSSGWGSAPSSDSVTPAPVSAGWGSGGTASVSSGWGAASDSSTPAAAVGGWGAAPSTGETTTAPVVSGWGAGGDSKPADAWGSTSSWGDSAAADSSSSSQAAPPARGGGRGGGGRPMRGTAVAQPRGGYKLMVKLGDNHTFTKESLEAAFSAHGAVSDTYVPDGKHFAFVSFDSMEVAETAGTALNGSMVNGTRIFCDWAQPKGSAGGGGAPGGKGCFKCGQEGHMSRDCTGAPASTTDSSSSSSSGWGAPATGSSGWGDSAAPAVASSGWGSTPSCDAVAATPASGWGAAPSSDSSSAPAPVSGGWGAAPAGDAPAPAAGGWATGGGDSKPADAWGSASTWGDSAPADSASSQAPPPARGGFAGGRGRGRPMRGTAVAQPRGGYKLMVKLGNDHTFTKESLESTFSAHGPVSDCYVPEGKHFAFVSFESQEVAETAGTALNGSELSGKRIFCDWAQPKGGAPAPATTTDSSAGGSSDWGAPATSAGWGDSAPTGETSAPAAVGWGTGGDSQPASTWGSASTWGDSAPADTSNSSQAAPPARGGFSGGRGRGRPMRGTAVAQPRGGYKLMVKLGNDHTFTKESLESAFSAHGPVSDCYIPEGKHFAFVSFETQEVAETAGTALNGSELNGKRIFCDWAQPKGGAPAPASTTDSSAGGSSDWGAPATSVGWGDSSATPATTSGWGSTSSSPAGETPAPAAGGWGSGGDSQPAASWGSASTWGDSAPADSSNSCQTAPPARGGFSGGRGRGRPMRGTAVAQPRGGYKLMVKLGNDHTFTKETLESVFAEHGKVTDVYVPEGKHFAFVSFDNQDVAETAGTALNGSDLNGKRIFCDWAQPKGGAPAPPAATSDSSANAGGSSGWGDSSSSSGWGSTSTTSDATPAANGGWGTPSGGETITPVTDSTAAAGGWGSGGDSTPALSGWGDAKPADTWGGAAASGGWGDSAGSSDEASATAPAVETYTKEQYEAKKRADAEAEANLVKEREVRDWEEKVAALKRENQFEEQRKRELARSRDVPPPPRRKSAMMSAAGMPIYQDILEIANLNMKVPPQSPTSSLPPVLRQSSSYSTRGDLKAKMEMDAGFITPATRDPTQTSVPFSPNAVPDGQKSAMKKLDTPDKPKSIAVLSSDEIFFPVTPATKGRKRKSTGEDDSADYIAPKSSLADLPIVEGRTRSAAKRAMPVPTSPVSEPTPPPPVTTSPASGGKQRKRVSFADTPTVVTPPVRTRNDPPPCDSPPREPKKTRLIASIGNGSAAKAKK